MSFTKEEIDKINYNKRYGYVFSAAFMFFGAIVLLLNFILNRDFHFFDIKVILTIIITIVVSVFMLFGINRKLNVLH